MQVKPAEETLVSPGAIMKYGGLGTLLISGAFIPAVLVPGYMQGLNTVLLLALFGLIGRTFLAAGASFKEQETPTMETDEPGVSLIIPAYNEEPVLPGTIDALTAVDYPKDRLQVILCYEEDSSDRTGEICEKAAAEHDFIEAVRRDEHGGGKAKATNYALEYAEHDIIAGADADHRFKEDAIRKAVRWFQEDDDIWCVKGRCYGSNPGDSIIALHATVERHIAEKIDIYSREVLDGFTYYGGGQFFFRRAVIDQIGELDEDILVEDIDMSAKIHRYGKEIKIDPSVITYEENPSTLRSWWAQRKRWSRGWMQVAKRHFTGIMQSDMSLQKKVDAGYSLIFAVLSAFMVLMLPLFVLSISGFGVATFVPYSNHLWKIAGLSPALFASAVFYQDYR
ncbi:MAG: glycosyltransferase family 2 protein, partial [Candidatus Nanohaloarchaea archaeon]|nr:glycosyltransferase family 2 protein [Candidatus Nanohaloarchaea archaeon]